MAPTLHPRTISSPTISPLTTDLLIALLALIIVILISATTLVVLRRYRRAQKVAALASLDPESPTFMPSDICIGDESAPAYDQKEKTEICGSTSQQQQLNSKSKQSKKTQHRRTNSTVEVSFNRGERPDSGTRPSVSSFVYESRLDLIRNSSAPPPRDGTHCGEVPELRITFPDEIGEDGFSRGGRVVVVRIGERGYGLEPLDGGEVRMMDAGRVLREK